MTPLHKDCKARPLWVGCEMNDYAHEVNRSLRAARRRRQWAWAGMICGTCTGAIGLGSLLGLAGAEQAFVLAGLLVWFAWSLLQLR